MLNSSLFLIVRVRYSHPTVHAGQLFKASYPDHEDVIIFDVHGQVLIVEFVQVYGNKIRGFFYVNIELLKFLLSDKCVAPFKCLVIC